MDGTNADETDSLHRAEEPGAAQARRSLFQRDGVLFLMLVAIALAVRLIYLWQARKVPFFEYLLVDARRYHEWAQEIAGGNWLGDGVFFQAPLYPYSLGLLYKLIGAEPWRACIAQAVLGSFACGLLFVAGRLFVSRAAGFAAGLLLALYAPAIFFDGLIQKASLASFLMTGLLALLAWTLRAPTTSRFAAVGAALGLLSLTRENARILAVPVLIWGLVYFAVPIRRRILFSLAVVGGMAAVLVPVGFRNLAVGGEFVVSSSQLGPNFFIGNNAYTKGTYMPLVPGQHNPAQEEANARQLAERAAGRELSTREVSDFWLNQAWQFIRDKPGPWLALISTKWGLVWNAYEIPDANDLYFYQDFSALLRWAGRFNHFGVLCPLAAAGVALTWRRRRELWILYALALTVALSVTAFFVLSRYRYPLVPVAALFAGGALVELPRLIRLGAARTAAVLGLIVVVAVFCNRRVALAEDMRSLAIMNYADVLTRQGKIEAAIDQFERGLSLVPDDAEGHYQAGVAYLRLRQYEAAVEHFRAATEIDPTFYNAFNRLGVALGLQGRFDEAITQLEQALHINSDQAQSLYDLGNVLRAANRLDEAEASFRRALRAQPNLEEAVSSLFELSMERMRYADALSTLRDARADLPRSELLLENLARFLMLCPDPKLRNPLEAVSTAETLCELDDFKNPLYLDTLASAYASAGRFDDAVQAVEQAIRVTEAAGLDRSAAAFRMDRERYLAGRSPLEPEPTKPDAPK